MTHTIRPPEHLTPSYAPCVAAMNPALFPPGCLDRALRVVTQQDSSSVDDLEQKAGIPNEVAVAIYEHLAEAGVMRRSRNRPRWSLIPDPDKFTWPRDYASSDEISRPTSSGTTKRASHPKQVKRPDGPVAKITSEPQGPPSAAVEIGATPASDLIDVDVASETTPPADGGTVDGRLAQCAEPNTGGRAVPIARIEADTNIQARAGIHEQTREEYVDAMRCGEVFPAIIVFDDGEQLWLADGFHRLEAARRTGLDTIDADVRNGGRRDAILYAVGANTQHGLRRTKGDRDRAMAMLLQDAEWCKWSDREIGRQCNVDHKTVGRHRKRILGNAPDAERTVKRGDKTYQMNTGSIGRSSTECPVEPGDSPDTRKPASDFTTFLQRLKRLENIAADVVKSYEAILDSTGMPEQAPQMADRIRKVANTLLDSAKLIDVDSSGIGDGEEAHTLKAA